MLRPPYFVSYYSSYTQAREGLDYLSALIAQAESSRSSPFAQAFDDSHITADDMRGLIMNVLLSHLLFLSPYFVSSSCRMAPTLRSSGKGGGEGGGSPSKGKGGGGSPSPRKGKVKPKTLQKGIRWSRRKKGLPPAPEVPNSVYAAKLHAKINGKKKFNANDFVDSDPEVVPSTYRSMKGSPAPTPSVGGSTLGSPLIGVTTLESSPGGVGVGLPTGASFDQVILTVFLIIL